MLEIQRVSKTYASNPTAVDQLSLRLHKGDFCIVIGPNGSGKSTLFKMLSGEIAPDKGNILLNQQDITLLSLTSRASMISSVIQDPLKGTIPEMTLMENLSLSLLRAKQASLKSFKQYAVQLKEKMASLSLGFEHYMDKPLAELSGGQRQFIATLMATLTPPQLLLLDEHCSALDPKTHKHIMSYTQDTIKKHHLTALMITHNLPDALAYGNRLIMLNKGKIVLDLDEHQKKSLTLPQLLKLFHQNDFVAIQRLQEVPVC